MGKKLGVIGCGIAAVPILNKARELGIETFSFGLSEIDKTKGLSDHFVKVDLFDIDTIYNECLKIGLDGIIATSEISTEVTAILANKLNLPGNSVKDGFAGRNKFVMRERMKDLSDICQPRFFIYGTNIEFSYPVMVKAIDGCGKNGITLARNEEELHSAVAFAQKVSSFGEVLIEEYIENGTEYSVECLSCDGIHYTIQVTQKDSSGPPHFVEMGHHQPGVPRNSERFKLIERSVCTILDAIGIMNSMSHVEIKITDDEKVYFIELGARAGGDFIADKLVGLSVDYDYYKGAIDIALGQFTPPTVEHKAYAGVYFLGLQTKRLLPLFHAAQGTPWCHELRLPEKAIGEVHGNSDTAESGYLIYQADHKISLKDVTFVAERINDDPEAFAQLYAWNKKIGRDLTEEELVAGIQKFLQHGNAIAIRSQGEILAFMNVYCNDYDTLNAYINNMEVLECYRGLHLSKLLLEKAIHICEQAHFKTITGHVAHDNVVSMSLHTQYGFVKNDIATDNGMIEIVKQL